MITLDLMGGLANQAFIYALGRALEARGQEVQFDTSILDVDSARRYMLADVGLNLKLVSLPSSPVMNEGDLRFKPEFLEVTGDKRLHGFFQSEKYFLEVQDQIRNEVFTTMQLSAKTREVASQIGTTFGNEQSCFVHFRRSDNLLPHKLRWHGLTSAEDSKYYERAVTIIHERVPGVQFFIFSDDKDYLRRGPWLTTFNRLGHIPYMVDHNEMSGILGPDFEITRNFTGRECEDLWLMSLCRHAIIANSTFSWWGAWLNQNENHPDCPECGLNPDIEGHADDCSSPPYRIVIAPQEWFSTPELDATDIVPKRWLKVSLL